MNFGLHLRRMRLDRHISQRDLAKQIGIDFTYISKIEGGHIAPPSEDVIRKIAQVLNADENDLINQAGKVPAEIKVMLHNNPLLTELLRVLSEKTLPDETYGKMLLLVPDEVEREHHQWIAD